MIYQTQHKIYDLQTILLDLNGTLAIQGKIKIGTINRINKLKRKGFEIFIVSGDQRGNLESIAQALGVGFFIAHSQEEKSVVTSSLKKENTVAVGNARIDKGIFQNATIRIGLLQKEGLHIDILESIDILMLDINDVFDMLLDKDIFCATMKQ